MADFKKDAKQLLEDIGGAENISAVTHCATRMRFVLNDPGKADNKKIEKIPSVKGTFTQAGQYQVIIGNRLTFELAGAKTSGRRQKIHREISLGSHQMQHGRIDSQQRF